MNFLKKQLLKLILTIFCSSGFIQQVLAETITYDGEEYTLQRTLSGDYFGNVWIDHSGATVEGSAIIHGHLYQEGVALNQSRRFLNLNGGQLTVQGDYKSAYLSMNQAEEMLTVNGDMSMYSHTDFSFSAGEMIVKGNLNNYSTKNNFSSYSEHKITLAGTGDQEIQLGSSARVDRLHITNQTGVMDFTGGIPRSDGGGDSGWTFEGDVLHLSPRSLRRVGGELSLPSDTNVHLADGSIFSFYSTRFSLNGHTLSFDGDVRVVSGLVETEGGKLQITGDLTHEGGTLVVGDGEVVVSGDYRIQTPSELSLSGYADSSGILVMQDSAGQVVIDGDFVTESHHNHTEYLTAGEITLKGDFTQISWSAHNFAASGTHRVTLVGDGQQKIRFDDPLYSQFAHLHIANESGELSFDPMPTKQWTYTGDVLELKSFELVDGYISLEHDINVQLSVGEAVELSASRLSLNGHNLTVDGPVEILSGALDIDDSNLTIAGDLIHSGGELAIGSGKLLVGGDYRIQTPSLEDSSGYVDSSGLLKMQDSAGRVAVDGDFITESHHNHAEYLTAGQMTLKGNFTQVSWSAHNFAASESHRVVLVGDEEQHVHFDDPLYSQFAKLHIANESGQVSFDPMPTKQWSYEGDVLELQSLKLVDGSFRLSHDINVTLSGDEAVEVSASLLSLSGNNLHIDGDLKLLSGAFDIDDSKLTVTGDLIQSGGVLSIGSGQLDITGDYRIQTPSELTSSGYTDSSGFLEMQDSAGRVKVDGDFITESHNNHEGYLTAGQMTLKGDFTQKTYSNHNFAATEAHKVVLVGEGEQRVRFDDPLYSQFAQLHITNESGELSFDPMPTRSWTYTGDVLELDSFQLVDGSIRLSHAISVQPKNNETTELSASLLSLNGHNLSIDGDVTLLSGALNVDDSKLTVTGDFTQPAGVLAIESGQMYIGGDYRIQTETDSVASGYTDSSGFLQMLDENGRLTVDGDFVTESHNNHTGYLTAGQLTVKGDFTQITYSNYNFAATDSHKVVLAGDDQQQVRFGDPTYSHFAQLHIENQTGKVDLDVMPHGALSYAGDVLKLKSFKVVGGVLSLSNDISVELANGEVADLSEGRLLLNGYNLDIDGDMKLNSGSLDIQGGKLSITGDLIQPGGALAISNGELVVAGDYRIQTPSLSSPTGYTDSSGLLTMKEGGGRLTVFGDFVTESQQDHTDSLVAGRMILKGNFTQRVSSYYNFISSQAHQLIFSGNTQQLIRIESPLYSTFGTVILINSSDSGVKFLTEAIVTKLFEHGGNAFSLFTAEADNFPDYDGDGAKDHLDPFPMDASIASLDRDGDGVLDADDLFPEDGTEWLDTDFDGVGNNEDTDDDNDGISDVWELANGLNPLNANDARSDYDGDNVINLDEYRSSTDPQLADTDGDGINDDLDQVAGMGLWGYACNVVNDPNSTTRRWGINQYNLADLPNAKSMPVYSMSKNRTIQSVACAPSGESVLFSMKDSVRGDYEIYELETSSGLVTQITNNDTDDADVTRSRNGRTVVWQMRLADGRQALELRQYQDNGEFTSTTLASANPFVQPSLSPNGNWLTFVQLRPSSFAVMRYDILNGKYKEVRVIARRKKLYHPSITDDGNKVGWSERTSMLRYRVKDLMEDTTTDVVYNVNGVEHAVLSGDGKHVIYSVNTADQAETYLTALDTLDTIVIGETLTDPVRYLSNNWLGSLRSNGFVLSQVSGRHLRSVNQSMTFWLRNDGSGVRYTLGSDDEVSLTWQLDDGVLTLTEQGNTSVRVIRLLAAIGNQFTVSMISPDGKGGIVRHIDTVYQE